MNPAIIHISVVLVLIACANIESAKILAILPYAGTSHNIFIRAITEEIASRGHQVTYYTCLPSGKKVANLKEILLNNTVNDYTKTFNFNAMRKIGRTPYFGFPGFFLVGEHITDRGLNDPSLAELIKSDEKYDLVILEPHFGQEAFVAFGHKFGAPVVSINPFTTFFSIDEYIGNPFGVAYLPGIETPYTDKMTFFQRAHNLLRTCVFIVTNYLVYLPKQDSLMRKYFNYNGSENIPPISDMLQDISLFIVNSHSAVDYPRAWVPNVIPAAGVHISSNRKPLPQDLKDFMDNSKNGVIYVSFGSLIPSEQMPDDMKQAFINAFSKLNQNVLWKMTVDYIPGLSKNVKLSKWLPQHDVLAHPNCLAFITHGGLLSQQEAVYFGVPLIGVPIFGDQFLNVMRAADRGFAVHLDQYNITSKSVLWAVNEVVNKPTYREAAKRYSDIFRDNPLPPTQNAAHWIEYVLRHNGAPHLRSEGRKLSYVKYLLIDVIAFTILILGLSLFIVYKVIKISYAKLFYRDCNQDNSSKKTN